MQSKRSCFNGPVFRKNLTRFAPAWMLYTLCLVLGVLLLYSNGGTMKQWHFAANMLEMPQIMSLLNLIYAPVVALLIFGDLYVSRMCNALHAMPMRRENWYVTNYLSGIAFAAIPTAVMSLLTTLLSAGSVMQDAWQIPWLTFGASMLEFVCFFGMALMCVMCAGTKLTAVMLYSLVNGGAFLTYWLIETVYTPMLYGVITPDTLADMLTPIAQMVDNTFLETQDSLYSLREVFGEELVGAVSTFELVKETWITLLIWAGAGLGFAVAGLVLYRKRDLECAGDALAFSVLEPLFQVLGALVSATAGQFLVYIFLGDMASSYLVLGSGLVVGWFACRMLIDRSTHVFKLRSWIGLAGLVAVLAASLVCTRMDVLGIESWVPKAEDVESIQISNTYNYTYTEREDVERVLNIHAAALENRLEYSGSYVQDENGQWVRFEDYGLTTEERADYADVDCRLAFYTTITYTMKNGKTVSRRYNVWSDGPAGDDARALMSRWEILSGDRVYKNGVPTEEKILDLVLRSPESIYMEGADTIEQPSRQLVDSLLAAVKADCDAGNMAQIYYLHSGHFRMEDAEVEGGYYYRGSLQLYLEGNDRGWHLDIYPECENTIAWLRERGMLNYDVMESTLVWY